MRVALLNSRAYGSPQSRIRFFNLAARLHVPLPTLPLPTHADPEAPATRFALEENTGHDGFYIGRGTVGTGPLPAVTIDDAISDLPC